MRKVHDQTLLKPSIRLTLLQLQFFDNRKQTLENFESHLRSLLAALATAAKLRTTLQTSLGELQSAFLGLSQCDLSSQLRGALEQSAAVQRQLRELSEKQSSSEEQIGGITSVAEGYARLCGSVKVGLFSDSYAFFQADSILRHSSYLVLESKHTMFGKPLNRIYGKSNRLMRKQREPVEVIQSF